MNNEPASSSVRLPEATTCAAVSVLIHSTCPPAAIVTVVGRKHPSAVSSHPGAPDPGAMSTTASLA